MTWQARHGIELRQREVHLDEPGKAHCGEGAFNVSRGVRHALTRAQIGRVDGLDHLEANVKTLSVD